MSIFENNFALKPSNVLSSLDQLINTLQSINEITVYFKRIISGEIEIDLVEAKKILSLAETDKDNQYLDQVADYVFNDSVQNLDPNLNAFLVKKTPTESLSKIQQALAFYICDQELVEYITKKGALLVISLDGVPVKTAKEYDPYAFIYNQQTLIRAKHITELPDSLLTHDQQLIKEVFSNVTDTDSDLAQLSELRRGSARSAIPESESNGVGAAPTTTGTATTGQGIYRNGSVGIPENHDASLLGTGNRGNEPTDRGNPADLTGNDSSGSRAIFNSGSPTRDKRNKSIIQSAKSVRVELEGKAKLQAEAEGTPTDWGDPQNISEALPYLLTEQCDDIVKAEKRLIQDNANGILFTNGTGTGKTFTGLGTVKRFLNADAKNILIITLSDKIARDFIKSGKPLNIDIHQLASTHC